MPRVPHTTSTRSPPSYQTIHSCHGSIPHVSIFLQEHAALDNVGNGANGFAPLPPSPSPGPLASTSYIRIISESPMTRYVCPWSTHRPTGARKLPMQSSRGAYPTWQPKTYRGSERGLTPRWLHRPLRLAAKMGSATCRTAQGTGHNQINSQTTTTRPNSELKSGHII